jgi:hypothetical protein
MVPAEYSCIKDWIVAGHKIKGFSTPPGKGEIAEPL